MKSLTSSRGAILALALGALLGFSSALAAKPKLTIDCSFTGYAGQLCEEAGKAWAAEKKVDLKIQRKSLTSTEKLKLYTRLLDAASMELDVFGVDIIWPALLHKHLYDLKPTFSGDLSGYLPLYIENNTVNGRLLAVPFNVSAGMLYYRSDLLRKYSRKVPETWEELTETAAFIQEKERTAGKKDLWGFVFQAKPYEGLTCGFLEWSGSYLGSPVIDDHGKVRFNTSNVEKSLQTAASWIGSISPPEVLAFSERESHDFYKQGNAVFLRAWPSAWAEISSQPTGVMLIPKGGRRGSHSSVLGGWSVAVSKYSRHPELAADLVKRLTGLEAQKKLGLAGGGSPSRLELYQDPRILKSAPQHSIMLPLLSSALLRPSKLTRASYPEVSEIIWTEVHKTLKKEQTALVAISKIQEKLDAMSVRWKK